MNVFIVPNSGKQQALALVLPVVKQLKQSGATVLLEEKYASLLSELEGVLLIETNEAYRICDVVVTIGGDGTMLHAARHTMRVQKPLLGINSGRLGFLTIIEPDELSKLNRLIKEEYTVEQRSVLAVKCEGEEGFSSLALNDIVLFKELPEKTISLDIYCDDILVSRLRGDGVVFSTPTGSTAYSMSAGGPILDARLGGVIVTQICAHIVQMPPMVFASDRVLTVVSQSHDTEKVFISCDGMKSKVVAVGQPVKITQSNLTVPLIEFSDAGQLKSIDTKLKGR